MLAIMAALVGCRTVVGPYGNARGMPWGLGCTWYCSTEPHAPHWGNPYGNGARQTGQATMGVAATGWGGMATLDICRVGSLDWAAA